MRGGRLQLRLYGSFTANWTDGKPLRVPGAKQRALLAILAVSPEGAQSRAWLQECLWGFSDPEHGRSSLRRCLADLKVIFGDRFDDLFEPNKTDIRIRKTAVEFVGRPDDGEFLQGLDIREEGFNDWLRARRMHGVPAADAARARRQQLFPTLAVIPLMPLSDAAADQVAGDMLAMEITRTLSRSNMLKVISHLSSRRLSLRTLDLSMVKRSFDADYLVCGTLRRTGVAHVADIDLIDMATDEILWSMPFPFDMSHAHDNTLETVAEIAWRIGSSILRRGVELARIAPLNALEIHTLFVAAVSNTHRSDLKRFSDGREQFRALAGVLPDNSVIQAWLAKWHILAIAQGWSSDVAKDTDIATLYSAKALELNPECSFSLAVDGMVSTNRRAQADVPAERFKAAIDINPNNSLAWLLLSRHHAFAGNGQQAIDCSGLANALSPIDPFSYFYDMLTATAHLVNEDLETALTLADRSLSNNRHHASTLRLKTVTLQKLGRAKEAAETAGKLVALEPGLTVRSYLQNHPASANDIGKDWADCLGAAGVPSN